VVHDAIHYGEAFRRDQKREHLSDELFAALDDAAAAVSTPPSNIVTTNQPGTAYDIANSGGLPGQQPVADLKHRLPEPRNQLMGTLLSPWVWTAIAILIIIYFIAALA
jgi:hypothetical protein